MRRRRAEEVEYEERVDELLELLVPFLERVAELEDENLVSRANRIATLVVEVRRAGLAAAAARG
jgi:hypothetical protein